MTEHLFILVPSLRPTGPVKGAIALANALCAERRTTLLSLKDGPGASAPIDPRVALVELHRQGGWLRRIHAYRKLLEEAGGRARVASISSCFSADIVNLFSRRYAITCASVRGNLIKNYSLDYGLAGTFLAWTHLLLLRRMDQVVAMTRSMAEQLASFLGRMPMVIGNFVDERELEPYRSREVRSGPYEFVFVGSLSRRKQPDLLIRAAAQLKGLGHAVHITMIGDGAMRHSLENLARELDLARIVDFVGHVANPYPWLSQADGLVLPSLSEGVSRAMLEALFLGVPCVVRDVDGTREVITEGANGFLFKDDSQLATKMIDAGVLSRMPTGMRPSLLAHDCRQAVAAKKYLQLVDFGYMRDE